MWVLIQGISYINIPSVNFISQIRKSQSKQLSVRLLVDDVPDLSGLVETSFVKLSGWSKIILINGIRS